MAVLPNDDFRDPDPDASPKPGPDVEMDMPGGATAVGDALPVLEGSRDGASDRIRFDAFTAYT